MVNIRISLSNPLGPLYFDIGRWFGDNSTGDNEQKNIMQKYCGYFECYTNEYCAKYLWILGILITQEKIMLTEKSSVGLLGVTGFFGVQQISSTSAGPNLVRQKLSQRQKGI